MIDRDVEEPLDLARVQVEREDAIHARRLEQVGDELGGDGHPRLDLAILAGVAVVRQHRGDPAGRRALERVDHDQQLHQVVVHGRARRLDDEDVRPRTFSLTWTNTSPSEKRMTSASHSGTLRY